MAGQDSEQRCADRGERAEDAFVVAESITERTGEKEPVNVTGEIPLAGKIARDELGRGNQRHERPPQKQADERSRLVRQPAYSAIVAANR
jgi:hypothetical protein